MDGASQSDFLYLLLAFEAIILFRIARILRAYLASDSFKRTLKELKRTWAGWRRRREHLSRKRYWARKTAPKRPSAFLDWFLLRTNIPYLERRGDIPSLTLLLDRDDQQLRTGAIAALGRLKDPEATGSLVRHLFESSEAPYGEIISALGQIGNEDAVAALKMTYLSGYFPLGESDRPAKILSLRRQILGAMGKIASESAITFLRQRLSSKRGVLYLEAVLAAAETSNPRFIEPMTRILFDFESALPPSYLQHVRLCPVRCAIVAALGKFTENPAVSAILLALDDDDRHVKEEAIRVLESRADHRTLPELKALADSEPDPLIRLAARSAVDAIRNRLKQFPQLLLERRGFAVTTEIDYLLKSRLYWHPQLKVELMVTNLDQGYYTVKAMKKYYIKAVSETGHETWQRNLGELMERLRVSFPEFHLYAAGMMRVPQDMVAEDSRIWEQQLNVQEAYQEMQHYERTSEQAESQLSRVERQELVKKAAAGKLQGEIGLDTAVEGAEWQALRKRIGRAYEKLEQAAKAAKRRYEQAVETLKQMMDERHKFFREFQEKGAASCYVIGYASELRVGKQAEFEVLVNQALEDIRIAHIYGGFTQALERGLRIFHEEVEFPWVLHQAEAVGLFAPDHFQKFPQLEALRDEVIPMYMVTAVEDIVVDGKVKEKGKRTPAKVFQAFMDKVERIPDEALRGPGELPLEGGWVGQVMLGKDLSNQQFFFPLNKLNHGYVSGTTGSGKSFLARVIVENALLDDVNVIVLDATRQWSGLIKPAESGKRRLNRLGIERDLRRGFPVKLYLPSQGIHVPRNLNSLLTGGSVISLMGMKDEERCRIAADVLELAYAALNRESNKVKTLIVLEEAHSILPGHVADEARDQAVEVRNLIDRISRESRKYGLNLLLISQSLSDFKGESKIVREMTNSKFFCRATDMSEINYVESFISRDAGLLVKTLQPGEALINNPFFGPVKVFVRPPFSHVGELSPKELQEWLERSLEREKVGQPKPDLDGLEGDERRLLDLASKYLKQETKLHVTKAQELLGIKSKRQMQDLVDELESKGYIRTEYIEGRGRPRVIYPAR